VREQHQRQLREQGQSDWDFPLRTLMAIQASCASTPDAALAQPPRPSPRQ
jgi:hypothetical protein